MRNISRNTYTYIIYIFCQISVKSPSISPIKSHPISHIKSPLQTWSNLTESNILCTDEAQYEWGRKNFVDIRIIRDVSLHIYIIYIVVTKAVFCLLNKFLFTHSLHLWWPMVTYDSSPPTPRYSRSTGRRRCQKKCPYWNQTGHTTRRFYHLWAYHTTQCPVTTITMPHYTITPL